MATTWTHTPMTGRAIDHLDLKNVNAGRPFHGGGEVVRYIGRHGTKRVSKAVLIGASRPSY